MDMKFSIIIPAYNEHESITRAIGAIQGQILDREDSYEIIVVDNNSSDDTARVAKIALGSTSGKVVSEEKPGPNLARQKGFIESTGSIICFLDADCWAPKDWLTNIKREIEKGAVAVSGPYYYGFLSIWQRVLNVVYVWIVLPATPLVLRIIFWRKAAIILGGNFAVTREALQKIGGIPPVRFWGDDTKTAILLAQKAGKVKFSVKVWVESSPRRFERVGFWKLNMKYIGAYFQAFLSKSA